MHARRRPILITLLSLAAVLCSAYPSLGQTFSSGSTGADGAYAPPTSPTSITLQLPASGIFNFTTVNVPLGVTVTILPNAANTPVTMLATGDVTITGTVRVNGAAGGDPSTTAPGVNPGALGGPGGFQGGSGGTRDGATLPGTGHGPGGGVPATTGAAGSGSYPLQGNTTFVSLLPLFGGSGGGGGKGDGTNNGGGAGGGGGAIVIASSTKITVPGSITAIGGAGGASGACVVRTSGSGSGGAIRLVAPQIMGAGTLSAAGGLHPSGCGGGGNGRIRLEAFTLSFTGSSTPAYSPSGAPGPVTTASNPAVTNLPTIAFTIGGIAAPATPIASYTTADVSLPQGTTNPVSVMLTTTNTPAPTTFIMTLLPQFGTGTVLSVGTSGTTASASGTVNVTFPTGQVSVLNAAANFTLPLIASLFPSIDGEPAEQMMLAATYGGASTLTLISRSGKEQRVDELPFEDQVKVALAWEALLQRTMRPATEKTQYWDRNSYK
jgi:hypothetical protein